MATSPTATDKARAPDCQDILWIELAADPHIKLETRNQSDVVLIIVTYFRNKGCQNAYSVFKPMQKVHDRLSLIYSTIYRVIFHTIKTCNL